MLNGIVQCCLKLNEISTHHLYLGTIFLLLTYLGVFLFLLQALLLLHLFSNYPWFFLPFHSLPRRINMTIYQDTCRQDNWLQYIFLSIYFLKELNEKCQTFADTLSWLYLQVIKVSTVPMKLICL